MKGRDDRECINILRVRLRADDSSGGGGSASWRWEQHGVVSLVHHREFGIASGQLVGKQVTWQERQTEKTWVGPAGTQRGYARGGWKKFVSGRLTLQIAIFLVLHSPSTLSTSKNTRRVGPAWGVRRPRFGWEKFSIVFAPYSIDM
jgi:hypothetical protein